MENTDHQKQPLLSEKQAAEMLGISSLTLLRLRNSAKISFYRIGRRILFSGDQITEYLESVRQPIRRDVTRAA